MKKAKNKRQRLYSQGLEGLSTVTRHALPLLFLGLTILTGCQRTRPVVLYPIDQTDIILLNEGQDLKAPKHGAFLSDFYISEVMRSKVEAK